MATSTPPASPNRLPPQAAMASSVAHTAGTGDCLPRSSPSSSSKTSFIRRMTEIASSYLGSFSVLWAPASIQAAPAIDSMGRDLLGPTEASTAPILPQGCIASFEDPSMMLLQELLKYPSTQILLDKASHIETRGFFSSQKGDWKIKIKSLQISSDQPPARCDFVAHTIELDAKLPFELALSYLIFELINATFHDRHEMTYHKMFKGEMDCRSYVYTCEKNEHEACLIHRRIVLELIKSGQWPESMNIYRQIPDDFDTYWPQIEFTPHANYYVRLYQNVHTSLSELIARDLYSSTSVSTLPTSSPKKPA